MTKKILSKGLFVVAAGAGIFGTALFNIMNDNGHFTYTAGEALLSEVLEEPPVTHISTPSSVKGIYMTQCVVGTPDFREKLVNLIDSTELNTVIIDIKDFTGKISFKPASETLHEHVSMKCLARDMKEFIGTLHKKGIYVIGRITVFQDPYFSNIHPEVAVQKKSTGAVWKDKKGLSYVDPGAQSIRDYIVTLSEEAYAIGFDELNYDYIRYPSDGDMRDIFFPVSEARISANLQTGKAEVMKEFFIYLSENLSYLDVPLSADLFGLTTTSTNDLNIGQLLEYADPYFDYIAPMVYPSHYPPSFMGYQNPALYPYEVVKNAMDTASQRLLAASSTPIKLRPWLQDFNLGADYTADMVRAQMKATYDAGLTSWMLWDAANTYTKEALLSQ